MADPGPVRPYHTIRGAPQGLMLAVRLQPGAGANRIAGAALLADGAAVLKARVTAVAEKGKANAALIGLLAKALGLPKSAITITAGATDRRKMLRLEGDPTDLAGRLAGLL